MTLAEAAELALVHADAARDANQVSWAMGKVRDQAAADEYRALATEQIQATVSVLQSAGVSLPQRPPAHLVELVHLDTPDVRALLALLEQALPIAERIDEARGRALARPIAGRRGLDMAGRVSELVYRLQLDVYGPSEAVTGGRE